MISFKQPESEKKAEEFSKLAQTKAKEKFSYPKSTASNIMDNIDKLIFDNNEIPVTNFKVNYQQNIIQHQTITTNGDVLEKLGRPSIVVSCSCVFANSINPKKKDKLQNTYPQLFEKFRDYCLDGKIKNLDIPNFGRIPAMLATFNPTYDGKIRQGVVVEITFIEERELGINLPVNTIEGTAQQLQDEEPKLQPPLNLLGIPKYKDNIFDTVRKIKALVNYPATAANEVARDIDQLRNRIKTTIKSIKPNYNSTYARYNQLLYRLDADCIELKSQFEKSQSPPGTFILEYTTTNQISVTELTKLLNNSYDTLYRLNPFLRGLFTVRPNVVIRYTVEKFNENIGTVTSG